MTLHELFEAINPHAERFAHELAIDDATWFINHDGCGACRTTHDAASILCAFIHALDAAAHDGRPELLRDLGRRVGFPLSVKEVVG